MAIFRILATLREEGLLAKPKSKTSGGMSFEVVDAAVVERREAAMAAAAGGGSMGSGSAGGSGVGGGGGDGDGDGGGGAARGSSAESSADAFVSARFMPRKKLERLEERRVVSSLS